MKRKVYKGEVKKSLSDLERERDERNEAEHRRICADFERDYSSLSRVYAVRLNGVSREEVPKFVSTVRMLLLQLAGYGSFINRARPRQIRAELIDILSCPYVFRRQRWEIRDGRLVDETIDQIVVQARELNEIQSLINDWLLMLGKLARQIDSCESERVLRCIVAYRGRPQYEDNVSKAEAERMADELIYCFEAVLAEVDLLSPEKRVMLEYPRIPRHWPDVDVEAHLPDSFSPTKCTSISLGLAKQRYQESHFWIAPMLLLDSSNGNALKTIERNLRKLADDMDNRQPSLDRGEDVFDYKVLGLILSTDFRFRFQRYFVKRAKQGRKMVQQRFSRPMYMDAPQQPIKDTIIAHMRRYLAAAVAMAAESGSDTRGVWSELVAIFERRSGDFSVLSKADEDAAAAELKRFLNLFRDARQRLWSDWQRHCRKDIHDKPINTSPEGHALEVIRKDASRVRDAVGHILYYDSGQKLGIGPVDGRQMPPIREEMVRTAVAIIKNDVSHEKTLGQVVHTVIRRYAQQKGVYKLEDKDSFRKAISRECSKQGVDMPKRKTKYST